MNEKKIIRDYFDNTTRDIDPYQDIVNLRALSTKIFLDNRSKLLQKKYSEILKYDISLEEADKIREVSTSVANSGKSCGGKNFEEIISLVLKHNGAKYYREKYKHISGDFIFHDQKHSGKYVILSAKTTLRERWKQLVEEKNQRDVSGVYLITLDKRITKKTKEQIKKGGILLIEEDISFKDFISTHKMSDLCLIDLFCGSGGMSVGFQQAGFNNIIGVDNNITAINTYSTNHPTSQILCDNIKNISANDLLKKVGDNKINLIIGGPPCTSFSMAGKRDPNDIRASLFMDFIRIVNCIKPQVIVMENVPGILTAKTKDGVLVIDVIKSEYEKIGYRICYKKLNSADFAVPQKRNRVFFVGVRKDIKNDYNFPSSTHENKHISVKTILEDNVSSKYFLSEKMIEGFKKRKKENKDLKKGFGYQILDPDLPSYTISSRYYKDGSDALVKIGEKYRKLTEIEVARIQTFPSDYKFCGSSSEIYTQLGNAVPCLLAKIIAQSIKKFLEPLELTYQINDTEDEVGYKLSRQDLLAYNISELKNLCKSKDITGYSKYKKNDLVNFISSKLNLI